MNLAHEMNLETIIYTNSQQQIRARI